MKESVNAKVIVHMDIEWSSMVWIRATRRPLSVKWADLASKLGKTISVLLLSATDHNILMKMHNHSKLKSRQWSKSKRHRTKFEQNRIKWSNSALKLRQQLNKDWSKKERKKRKQKNWPKHRNVNVSLKLKNMAQNSENLLLVKRARKRKTKKSLRSHLSKSHNLMLIRILMQSLRKQFKMRLNKSKRQLRSRQKS